MLHCRNFILLLAATSLVGCAGTLNKLEQVGKKPETSEVKDPVREAGYEPLSWPAPAPLPAEQQYAGSLWQPGSRAFFRDQRAARVGDILRVNISINDKAEVSNETERKRDGTESGAAPKFFGLEKRAFAPLPGKADITNLVSGRSASDSKGTGTVKRQDKVETQVAVTITQILPNGNFVVDGKQEMLVNYDIREVGVKGVIRPQDIKSDNTIDSTQVAEARITYSGRGQLMDVQQSRWGSQVADALLPF